MELLILTLNSPPDVRVNPAASQKGAKKVHENHLSKRVAVWKFPLTPSSYLSLWQSAPRRGWQRWGVRAEQCWAVLAQRVRGRLWSWLAEERWRWREETWRTRHESRDGNACHIDEATAAELSDRLGSASPLPLSLLRSTSSHFIFFFSLYSSLFVL